MASGASKILKQIEENEVEYVDLRFTDPKGKWQHLTMVASVIDEDMLTDGFMFDGSSIAGWKAINESDMILMPDLDATYVDPFAATPTLIDGSAQAGDATPATRGKGGPSGWSRSGQSPTSRRGPSTA